MRDTFNRDRYCRALIKIQLLPYYSHTSFRSPPPKLKIFLRLWLMSCLPTLLDLIKDSAKTQTLLYKSTKQNPIKPYFIANKTLYDNLDLHNAIFILCAMSALYNFYRVRSKSFDLCISTVQQNSLITDACTNVY